MEKLMGHQKKHRIFKAAAILLLLILMITGRYIFKRSLPVFDPLAESIEEDPCFGKDGRFYISNADDFLRFAGYINRECYDKDRPFYKEDMPAVYTDAVLLADIDLNKSNYYRRRRMSHRQTGIVYPFSIRCIYNYEGTLEGGDHTVTLLSDGTARHGMFWALERNGVVRNVKVIASQLTGAEGKNVGILCDQNFGLIENCRTEGSVEGLNYVGGIAGCNYGTIKDCVNRSEVVCSGTIYESGAGGIAGLNTGTYDSGVDQSEPPTAMITGCSNVGRVTGEWRAGGICGYHSGQFAEIHDSGNEADVSVRYQKVQPYLLDDQRESMKDEWEESMAGGIIGDMDSGTVAECWNTGTVFIEEEGITGTYGIAGGAWGNSEVLNCVSLAGKATGRMRHENIMELSEKEMELWKKDHEVIPYVYNNWQFDLDEAKEKVGIVPLGVTRSELTGDREDIYLCEDFWMRAPEGFVIKEAGDYALYMEAAPQAELSERYCTDGKNYQVWLLRLPEKDLSNMNRFLKQVVNLKTIYERAIYFDEVSLESALWLARVQKRGENDISHIWGHIEGLDWLHPLDFTNWWDHRTWTDDGRNSFALYKEGMNATFFISVPGDETQRLRLDNTILLPVKDMEDGRREVKYLLLVTDKENNYRPDIEFAKEVVQGFSYLPYRIPVKRGDTLSALAQRYTGNGGRYLELKEYNKLEDENRILEGQMLMIPESWIAEIRKDILK